MHRSGEAASLRRFPQKCPCCPIQSQRTFDEIGFFQHVLATSKYNPNAEIARAHRALLNDLKGVLTVKPPPSSSFIQPPAVREPQQKNQMATKEDQKTSMNQSSRETGKDGHQFVNLNSEVRVVWPWMGILMNIDYKQVTNNVKSNGTDLHENVNLINNLWDMDLKGYFSCFSPRGVHALCSQGLAVLDFGQDLLGCFDADDFAKGFSLGRRGKEDFQNMLRFKTDCVQEMFGWIADENDYNQMNTVGEFLRKRGTLRFMPRFPHAWRCWSEQHDQLFKDVRSKLQDKNFKLIELKREVCNLQILVCQAENQKDSAEMQLSVNELKHKQAMETIRENTDKTIQESKEVFLNEKQKLISLQAELMDFKKKVKLLEEKSTEVTSDEMLLQQLIDSVEEKERLEFVLQKVLYKEREANDKVQNAIKSATEVFSEPTILVKL